MNLEWSKEIKGMTLFMFVTLSLRAKKPLYLLMTLFYGAVGIICLVSMSLISADKFSVSIESQAVFFHESNYISIKAITRYGNL
jgi:hypothetical protein